MSSRPQGKALIVEDEEAWVDILAGQLRRAGYPFDCAPDPESAVSLLNSAPDDYGLVLLDAHFGQELHDLRPVLRVLQTLSELQFGGRVVVISGVYDEDELRHRLARFQPVISSYLRKADVTPERIRAAIHSATAQTQVGPAPMETLDRDLVEDWRLYKSGRRDATGKWFEDFVARFLNQSPYLHPEGERRRRTRTGEIDLVVRTTPTHGTLFQRIGDTLLVECKDREDKADKDAILSLERKLSNALCPFGLLFSRAGVTGRTEQDSAEEAIRQAYDNGHYILVFTDADIDAVFGQQVALYTLLETKWAALRFRI